MDGIGEVGRSERVEGGRWEGVCFCFLFLLVILSPEVSKMKEMVVSTGSTKLSLSGSGRKVRP